jgi:hypothetical protein
MRQAPAPILYTTRETVIPVPLSNFDSDSKAPKTAPQ